MATRSKYKDLADAEATKLEAEAPDDPDDDAEPEPEPVEDEDEAADEDAAEPEPEAAELSADEVQRRIEAAHAAYASKLEDTFAEAWADMHECPLCNALGFVANAGPVLKPDVELCPDCNGHGAQLTPSLVPEHVSETCLTCSGNGWRTRLTPVEPVAQFQNGPATAAPFTPTVPPMPVYDPTTNTWRDHAGNPLVGVAG